MHQPMGGHGVFPGERLVNAGRAAVVFECQILGSMHKAQMRAIQRAPRGHFAMRFWVDL